MILMNICCQRYYHVPRATVLRICWFWALIMSVRRLLVFQRLYYLPKLEHFIIMEETSNWMMFTQLLKGENQPLRSIIVDGQFGRSDAAAVGWDLLGQCSSLHTLNLHRCNQLSDVPALCVVCCVLCAMYICVVCGVWCVVCGVLHVACCVLPVVCDVWCVVCGVWCVVCVVLCVVWCVWCVLVVCCVLVVVRCVLCVVCCVCARAFNSKNTYCNSVWWFITCYVINGIDDR